MEPFPIAVFLSGGGTTLQNLIDRIAAGTLPVRIVQVVSSKPNAAGVERTRQAELPIAVVERKSFDSLETFSQKCFDIVRESGAQLVVLGGYLQLLRIPEDFRGRVINIHPALLPAFGGKGMYGHHVHEAVVKAGAKNSGCTVHYVDDQYDHGEVIAQRLVPVEEGDTAETLAARVFRAECELYPDVIGRFAKE